VLGNLGPLTAMVLACFIGHFFIFQALAIGVYGQNGFGVTSTVASAINSTPNCWDALYNLFGLMTTVSHAALFSSATHLLMRSTPGHKVG
jgi:hypothetical protein